MEAFPVARAMAQVVVRKIQEEIIPRYGLIEAIDFDKGSHFISKVIKEVF